MGKKKGGGGKAAMQSNIAIEFPPPRDQLSLLYRKARFDVASEGSVEICNMMRYLQDKEHRQSAKHYDEFLAEKKFWRFGDRVPDGSTPNKKPGKDKNDDKKRKK